LPQDTLRSALRAGTSALHQQLDDAAGEFDSLATYGRFVQRTHRFRSAVESWLETQADDQWLVDPVAHLAAADLSDLGLEAEAQAARRLGVFYVLEGSALGARLLVRRAEALGLSEAHGARHLSHQAADHERWRRFVHLLGAVPTDWQDDVLTGANSAFAFALSIYSEAAHEHA
jgi:heme oxygenase